MNNTNIRVSENQVRELLESGKTLTIKIEDEFFPITIEVKVKNDLEMAKVFDKKEWIYISISASNIGVKEWYDELRLYTKLYRQFKAATSRINYLINHSYQVKVCK